MQMSEYLSESARTVSPAMHPNLVDIDDLKHELRQAICAGEILDDIKKALFYGKTDRMPTPWRPAQAGDFDGVATDAVHAILGIFTEAVELLRLLSQRLEGGDPITELEVRDEAGDVMWYLALLFRTYGLGFEQVGGANIAKLRKRFPKKFDAERAINKDIRSEYDVLSSFSA